MRCADSDGRWPAASPRNNAPPRNVAPADGTPVPPPVNNPPPQPPCRRRRRRQPLPVFGQMLDGQRNPPQPSSRRCRRPPPSSSLTHAFAPMSVTWCQRCAHPLRQLWPVWPMRLPSLARWARNAPMAGLVGYLALTATPAAANAPCPVPNCAPFLPSMRLLCVWPQHKTAAGRRYLYDAVRLPPFTCYRNFRILPTTRRRPSSPSPPPAPAPASPTTPPWTAPRADLPRPLAPRKGWPRPRAVASRPTEYTTFPASVFAHSHFCKYFLGLCKFALC